MPLERPFELLGLTNHCKAWVALRFCLSFCGEASEIRTAYRKIALLIHPDKNPGSEEKCKDALIKLQQGREQVGRLFWLPEACRQRMTCRCKRTMARMANSEVEARNGGKRSNGNEFVASRVLRACGLVIS